MKRRSRLISPLVILGILAGIKWLSQTRDKISEPTRSQQVKSPSEDDSSSEDDLTEIEGIGPKSAGVLQKAGIRSYSQLAETEPEQIKEILKEAGMRTINPETWPEQAELAAQGDWDELYALRDELKGGRRV
jgi:predicted flap endonuclease-1-like 5' DNA nuclease